MLTFISCIFLMAVVLCIYFAWELYNSEGVKEVAFDNAFLLARIIAMVTFPFAIIWALTQII